MKYAPVCLVRWLEVRFSTEDRRHLFVVPGRRPRDERDKL